MMKVNKKKRAICFDVGGVLVKLGPPISSWLAPLDKSKLEKLLNSYSLGELAPELFFAELKKISGHPDNSIPIEKWFVEKRLISPFSGASAMLSKLLEAGIEVFLFSNTNETHWDFIRTFSFAYDHAFLSFMMKKKKPDPDSFKEVERVTGLAGKEIIFFDDSTTNVLIANSCGWSAHLVTGESPINNISEILRLHYQIEIH
ncbi:HAD-IA family hydrolase [Xanthomonas citri]|uniref:HAD-IA family hydrolase n=1 Tax=Xanthomonas citri TaxID=346 RepID=UPI0009C010C0|nr:HAD-IA family hydrolase [Xanthomonas citri]QEQ73729.1 hypothetical protein C2859_12435 [Xanthomonas citri pv. glycines]